MHGQQNIKLVSVRFQTCFINAEILWKLCYMRWAVHGTVVGVMVEFEDYIDQTRHNMTQNYSIITTESEQINFFLTLYLYSLLLCI